MKKFFASISKIPVRMNSEILSLAFLGTNISPLMSLLKMNLHFEVILSFAA